MELCVRSCWKHASLKFDFCLKEEGRTLQNKQLSGLFEQLLFHRDEQLILPSLSLGFLKSSSW